MTDTVSRPAVTPDAAEQADRDDLAELGYRQQLHRRLGPYSSFAAGFSFVSILTTVTELFGLGYSFGGPAFFFTWPLVFCGQILVALCFAELAARYPIAGCIYQWSKRLAGDGFGSFAGWMMLLGQIVSVAAAAIALQETLPTVWSGFELVGSASSSIATKNGATNAIILGGLLVVVTTIVNVIGVEVMAIINDVGVTCELIGVTALIILLLVHAQTGPGIVTHTDGVAAHGSYFWPFIVSTLMACYVMYGFDSAGELSEETRSPRATAPRSILKALAVSGAGGVLLLLVALMAIGNISFSDISSGGLSYLITTRLGSGLGKVILVDVSIAISVCTLAIQTAGSRMLFSLSRDGMLPGSRILGRIGRRGTPVLPSVVIGILSIALLILNLGQAAIFLALGSVGVTIVYLAYLGVTGPMLYQRLRGRYQPEPRSSGRFTLGRWGLPVNLVAVAWGVFIVINTAWPRAEVYDPAPPLHWYLHYFSLLFLAAAGRRQRRPRPGRPAAPGAGPIQPRDDMTAGGQGLSGIRSSWSRSPAMPAWRSTDRPLRPGRRRSRAGLHCWRRSTPRRGR